VRLVGGEQEVRMKSSISRAASVAVAALVLTAWTSQARADELTSAPGSSTTYVTPVAPTRDVITFQEKVPNAGLITGGAIMFGIPYATSVIVAASSDRAGDKHLFIPLAGPWMDLADRGRCRGFSCDNETSNQVLLVVDGILQGVGALQIVSGFIFPSTKTVTRTVGVHVTPTGGRSSVGLAAYGSF
jgi:hypothetical protein